MLLPNFLLLCGVLALSNVKADPVHIISRNFEQTVTSSTLQWVSTNGKDLTILKHAVVAAYQTIDDTNEPVIPQGVESNSNDVLKNQHPVYICRATVTGVWVTGQLRPQNHVCIVSLYKKVEEYHQFEVLVNIDNSARLSWKGKNKYTNIPQGAVTTGESRILVARKPLETNKAGSMTHYVGTFNPSENLGVYHLVDEKNNELNYEDGQLLVETEPIAYEFKSIKFKRTGRRFPKKKLALAHTVLKNDETGLQKAESVMDYRYNYFLSWGKGHGILKGLPFSVFLNNGSKIEGMWGLAEPVQKVETVPVEKYLGEGTAVNVTLVGNFTEFEIPYTATVVAIYEDNDRRDFFIEDTKRENKVVDVAFEFSPVYFLHNNSHVPTTTTTTTTTTSTTTTTTKTTSTTQEVTPMAPPEVIVRMKQEELHAESKKTDGAMASDEADTIRVSSSLKKKPDSSASSSTAIVSLFSAIYLMLVVILRVT